MKVFLLLLLVRLTHEAMAQVSPPFLVKAGEYADRVIPFADRYRYGEFRVGNVVYTDGKPPAVKLNYNLLLGEMQFINPDGDTANITSEHALRYVSIGRDWFVHDHKKGFVEIIADYPTIRLGLKQALIVVRTEVLMHNGYIATKELTTGAEAVRRPLVVSPYDTYLAKDSDFLLIDRNDRIMPANRSNVVKVFARHKKEVTAYLKAYPVNFRRQDELKKLLHYCSSLTF